MKSRVLIVDDSLTVRMDLEEAFTDAGVEVELCVDLASARSALQNRRFDLAIFDVLLPDGDGVDLLKETKENPDTAHIPVLLLSTEAEVRDRVRGLKTGADDYVGKPYDRSYIIDRAHELLRRSTAPKERAAPIVLIIDDTLTFREALAAKLQAHGYEAHVAETGEQGLRFAAQLRPDAIVVDGLLPGIDGPTVVRRMRTDPVIGRTPCLLLTGSNEKQDELTSLEAGADSYLHKDTSMEEVLARLTALLRSSASQPVLKTERSLFGPKRILAVDDSLTFLNELSEALRNEEYDVIQARNGEEALQLLQVQHVDCVLMDLMMPDLAGDEACRRIKSESALQDIPVIMLTARRERDTILSCLAAGADDFVPKSAEFDLLLARVRAQLRRKQFEEENRLTKEVASTLRKNETLLRALFEFAPDAIIVIDSTGRIVRSNGQVEAMFGYVRSELQDKPVEVLLPERYRNEHKLHRETYFRQPKVRSTTVEARRKDGSEFPVDIVLGPVHIDDGMLVVATVRDISERRQAENELARKDEEVREVSRQLWQATKLATMGELAASIAHELNNPLATVGLKIESLIEDYGEDSYILGELQVIEQEVDRMAKLVGNLLQFSRVAGNQMSTTDVCEEIGKTLELLYHHLRKRNIQFMPEFEPGLPRIIADRSKLRQLYINLIVNAADAMPKGGTLTIRVHKEMREGKQTMTIDFIDTGTGIPSDQLPKIMEPFFTTKPEGKGTGLGLSICRRVVEEHAGTIEVASEVGKGTRISVKLPITNGHNSDELDDDLTCDEEAGQ